MNTRFFKPKHNWVKFFIAILLLLPSCKNSGDSKKDNSSAEDDDTNTYNYTVKPETGAFNNRADTEKEERQKLILMQIDSTYAAIALLDEVKTEMTDLSPEGLTKAERNKKSKAIFNINIIQNELIRALDASILTNFKVTSSRLSLVI